MPGPLPTSARQSTSQRALPHSGSHQLGGTDPIEGAYYAGGYGSITQVTSITTSVECNARRGVITTVSSTLGAGSEASFAVSNSHVREEDMIVSHIKSTASAGGPFLVLCTAIADGTFTLTITNLSAATAANNTFDISFAVLSAVLE